MALENRQIDPFLEAAFSMTTTTLCFPAAHVSSPSDTARRVHVGPNCLSAHLWAESPHGPMSLCLYVVRLKRSDTAVLVVVVLVNPTVEHGHATSTQPCARAVLSLFWCLYLCRCCPSEQQHAFSCGTRAFARACVFLTRDLSL